VTSSVFGTLPDGRPVRRVAIGAAPGPALELLDLGATVHRLEVADGRGGRCDIAVGLPSPADYLATQEHVGGVIGRYANRIAHGRLVLDGREVRLLTNDGDHHLHGGPDGFDRRVWELVDHGPTFAELGLSSPDGDQGFPGALRATARYQVDDHRVTVILGAVADATTVVNLTSHAYFDLGADQELTVPAERYLPTDDAGIPVGGPVPVTGTPYDLRGRRRITDLSLDHNFVVEGSGLRTVAVLASPARDLALEVRSDQPGLQVYTGSELGGVALEPQRFPDTPNRPDFPTSVLRPGEAYRSEIQWVFGGYDGPATLRA